MKRTGVRLLAVSAVLMVGTAWAVAKGGTLYAKCNPTKVQKTASASGATSNSLAVGDEVKWQGADKKPYHKVETAKGNGFVDQSCLSPNKPATEYAGAGGAAISSEAFKSSGAATKGLSEGSIKYAQEKGVEKTRIAAQLIYVEENTKHRADPTDAAFVEWTKKAGVNSGAATATKGGHK